MSDPLADWWRHTTTVERLTGHGAYGPVHAPAADVVGAIDHRRRLVRAADGEQVISETTVRYPPTTAAIPPGSRVTLPATHGGRTAVVIAESRHDTGGQPTPDHLEVALT